MEKTLVVFASQMRYNKQGTAACFPAGALEQAAMLYTG
jgi:hypothetical protein